MTTSSKNNNSQPYTLKNAEEKLLSLQQLVQDKDLNNIAEFLSNESEYEIANLIESFPKADRKIIWKQVPEDIQGEVLAELEDDIRPSLMEDMTANDISVIAEDLDSQDLAEILDTVDDVVRTQVISSLDEDTKQHINQLEKYKDNEVGDYMDPETIQIHSHHTLSHIQNLLRTDSNILDDQTQELLVVDKNQQLLGLLSLVDLIKHPQNSLVAEWIDNALTINDRMDIHKAAAIFRSEDIRYTPVINEQGELVGQLNAEDIMEIIQDDVDSTMKRMAGVSDDEELFAPIIRSAKSRSVWLGINLLTALLAAFFIGQFEAVLSQVVALAVLMPIVASMGGIAGSQTLTVVIRGLAMGQIGGSNRWWLFNKEFWVGSINGVIWAVIMSFIAQLWFQDSKISVVIGIAIAINMTAANVSGIGIPLVLKKMGIDPALSASVILTTVTDIVGFVTFLGLASAILI